jgi:hypothetical protein
MGRKPGHDGLAQLAEFVGEVGHFVPEHPGVDEQYASPALHDNGVALAELALVDQHTLRDLSQHEEPPSACGLQPLVETLVPSGGRLQAVWLERTLHDDRASPAADGRTAAHPLIREALIAQVTRIAPERPIH